MQKTLTIQGKKFTGKEVAKLFDEKNVTNGGDYIIHLAGNKYFANYRQIQGPYFAPVCDEAGANSIALMPDNGLFKWSIWLVY